MTSVACVITPFYIDAWRLPTYSLRDIAKGILLFSSWPLKGDAIINTCMISFLYSHSMYLLYLELCSVPPNPI